MVTFEDRLKSENDINVRQLMPDVNIVSETIDDKLRFKVECDGQEVWPCLPDQDGVLLDPLGAYRYLLDSIPEMLLDTTYPRELTKSPAGMADYRAMTEAELNNKAGYAENILWLCKHNLSELKPESSLPPLFVLTEGKYTRLELSGSVVLHMDFEKFKRSIIDLLSRAHDLSQVCNEAIHIENTCDFSGVLKIWLEYLFERMRNKGKGMLIINDPDRRTTSVRYEPGGMNVDGKLHCHGTDTLIEFLIAAAVPVRGWYLLCYYSDYTSGQE